jgi:hypothetical protein
MGPELSATDLLVVLLLWSGVSAAVTAPGWAVVALAARRRRIARGPGRSWPAAGAGAVVAMLLSAVVVPAVTERLPAGDATAPVAVVAGWTACWLLAALVVPRRVDGSTRRTYATAGREH